MTVHVSEFSQLYSEDLQSVVCPSRSTITRLTRTAAEGAGRIATWPRASGVRCPLSAVRRPLSLLLSPSYLRTRQDTAGSGFSNMRLLEVNVRSDISAARWFDAMLLPLFRVASVYMYNCQSSGGVVLDG